jgi:hypothetical protein
MLSERFLTQFADYQPMKSPFLYYARNYPRCLIVDIHSYCNGRCIMCPYPKYSKRQTQGHMPWGLYTSIIDEYASIVQLYGFESTLRYCYMGEPFLAANLDQYVTYAQQRGINVYLNSNAAAMTPDKIDSLINIGFTGKYDISFHGITPAVHERIMGLDYQQCLANTLYLIEHTDPQNITVRGVNDNWPEGEQQKWFDFWKPKNVQLEYMPPISRGGSVKRILKHNRKADKPLRLYGCRCNLPLVWMIILFNGQSVICCQDMGRKLIWGDVSKDGIMGVWNGPQRAEAIAQLYTGQELSTDFLCNSCEEVLGFNGMLKSVAQTTWRKIRSPVAQVRDD